MRTSSARIIVTSALGVAFPLYTVPVFFASIVHVAVCPSLVTWSSKMPLVYIQIMVRVQAEMRGFESIPS